MNLVWYVVVEERRVLEQVLDKGDVGGHAADPEFAQGAVHTCNRHFRGLGLGRYLDQKLS